MISGIRKHHQKNKWFLTDRYMRNKLLRDINAYLDSVRGRISVRENLPRFYKKFIGLDETERFIVVNNLSETDNDAARVLLERVLVSDKNIVVRHEAAFSLGCIGDHGSRISLRHAVFTDESILVRHEAAMALSEIGTEEDLEVLNQGLNDENAEVVSTCKIAKKKLAARLNNLQEALSP